MKKRVLSLPGYFGLVVALSLGTVFFFHPATLPTAVEVLDNYIDALGGTGAIDRKSNLRFSGYLVKDVYWEHPPYDVVRFEAESGAPDQLNICFFRKDREGRNIIDCSGVFDRENMVWIFCPWYALNRGGIKNRFTVTGVEKVNGRKVYVVQQKGLSGDYHALYFDVKTSLLVRIGYYITILDYVEKDQVKYPTRIVQSRKGGSHTLLVKETTSRSE